MPNRADLLALPVADKLDIIEQLWDSLTAADKDELPLAEWQRQELDRRIDHLDEGVTMDSLLPVKSSTLGAFCRKHHIRRLAVFGSVLKGTARADSDIDLLVEFDAGHVPGLIGIAAMEIELSALLGGRKVDLRTINDLSRQFRDEVVRTARVEYAA